MSFDPKVDLPRILGAVGGLGGGSNAFMKRWQELEAMEAQRQQQTSQQAIQQETLGFQRDANTRAQHADQRATEDQTLQKQQQAIQGVTSLRQLLGDESIDDPTVFDERMAFAQNLAPQMGVDPGFLQTLRPTPDTFTKRKLKKLLDQHDKRAMAEREQFEQSGVWEVNGQRYTPAQARQALGTGGINAQTGQPFAFTKPAPAPDTATPGSFEEYVNLPPDQQALRRQQRKDFMQADDRAPSVTVNAPADTGGLPPRTQRAVDAQVNAFRNEAAVKRTNIVAEGVSFVDSVADNTTSPTEHQALIYAFAKAMDPESVVREGEYATVKKYAQSWLEEFKFDVLRVVDNQGLLTPEAIRGIKATIRKKYMASRGMYDNLRRQYAKQIDRITGTGNGAEYLIDYAAGFPAAEQDASAQPQTPRVTPPTGNSSSPGPVATGPVVNPYR